MRRLLKYALVLFVVLVVCYVIACGDAITTRPQPPGTLPDTIRIIRQ